MTILLTGGTGKTSLRVARLLQDGNISFLLASRRGATAAPDGMPAVNFNWLDSSTFENPFTHSLSNQETISAIYLISPEIAEPANSMNDFIDFAVQKHKVGRFVLLAGNSIEQGGIHVGKVWQHLVDIGVEYCVIRATWFMERMSEQEHLPMIKNDNKLYTACGDGKAAFISATDVAAVVFQALTERTPQHCDYRVIAKKLSSVLGRTIEHVRLSPEDNIRRYVESGFPEHYAKLLTWLETSTAQGAEERLTGDVERVTGRPPMLFDDWVRLHKNVWNH
ncbi:hypothetical protein H2200_002724 [Cladophialophora chaetospira]|uniref:Uncharacterized protein n=1 Tax=Cladophialophora chaetospira TaxID=386627 RepID=A0AA39CNC0_9EURO|nr:hypothetical protein H2200_002724 [Cladophialophora chaetospira]